MVGVLRTSGSRAALHGDAPVLLPPSGSGVVGDGPAAFLILIIGALIAVLAIWVQLAFEPAYWVHVVLWVPLATLMTIGGLRVAKAALLASEYRNKAGEGRAK